MIGFIQGNVLFSDGSELIVQTNTGVGYQVYHHKIVPEGVSLNLYISHVIRENSQELYGFSSLREKKLFEMLTSVKGVGPKSAYALVASLGADAIIEGVQFENKKALTKAPGIGQKAASQIILDLQTKIYKVNGYSKNPLMTFPKAIIESEEQNVMVFDEMEEVEPSSSVTDHTLLQDVLMACKELGFKEESILPVAQNLLKDNSLQKPEQLLHLVLKEM
jgi:Holliday junction DNA helicase RuvA